jgi:hypothetical protein
VGSLVEPIPPVIVTVVVDGYPLPPLVRLSDDRRYPVVAVNVRLLQSGQAAGPESSRVDVKVAEI